MDQQLHSNMLTTAFIIHDADFDLLTTFSIDSIILKHILVFPLYWLLGPTNNFIFSLN